jgi:oligopeptide/dipeptide ABC transporter ATP-binding protein
MLLSVQDLVVRFRTEDGTVHAVNGVSFDLDASETLGIVGESGCGKSATSLAITGLLPRGQASIPGGRILFDGVDVVDLPAPRMRELRGREIAIVFQDPMTSLNPVLRIGLQLIEALCAHRQMPHQEASTRAAELLRMVGIPDPAKTVDYYPHQLSGGMRQRVMIAMALALAPRLLIADEPTTALDVTIQAQVLELIRELTRRSGTAVMLITHDLGIVASMTQRVAVMYAGFVVETAPTRDLFESPRHPYTIGLLHSLPRLDRDQPAELVPIEGAPPEQRELAAGCPFAPRCAWRLEVCWTSNPPLVSVDGAKEVRTTGREASHRFACHNPATAEEARMGHPLRVGFVPAATPLRPSVT